MSARPLNPNMAAQVPRTVPVNKELAAWLAGDTEAGRTARLILCDMPNALALVELVWGAGYLEAMTRANQIVEKGLKP